MAFVSENFVLFFLLAMFLLCAPYIKFKRILLLAFNVVFYVWCGIGSTVLFALFMLMTYLAGRIIEKKKQKGLFVLFLVLALCPLLFYKYFDFLLLEVFALPVQGIAGKLSIPLGISFFTFQGIGYLIDVYKGKCTAEKNILNYSAFLSLFTCISSGPINRSEALLSQIRKYDESAFDYQGAVSGVRYVLIGLFMKFFIANCLSTVAPVSQEHGLVLLIASVCYTAEIYCDFCGYSYMAYGLSQIIGLDVIQNFDNPYRSCSLTEFWRRWHISLSSWLRDYVYIPLGGSRCSKIRYVINVLITFSISGIWHGANWTFIVWGFLNGLIIVLEKLTGFNKSSTSVFVKTVKWVVTLAVINTLWIFFDASSITSAFSTIKTICINTLPNLLSINSVGSVKEIISTLGLSGSDFIRVFCAFAAFVVFELVVKRLEKPVDFFESKYTVVRWIKYLIVVFIVLVLGKFGEAGAFIYADF